MEKAGPGGPLEELMDFETLEHDIDGVAVVVKAIGTGPAVLALHGAATLEGHEWARGLADRFRVYLPFHPGFGEANTSNHTPPSGRRSPSMPRMELHFSDKSGSVAGSDDCGKINLPAQGATG